LFNGAYRVPNNCAYIFKISWIKKATGSLSFSGNEMIVVCGASSGGVVSGTNPASVVITPNGTYAAASDIGISFTSNTVTFSVNGVGAPVDWQVTITSSLN
jgi:hypothetical protein